MSATPADPLAVRLVGDDEINEALEQYRFRGWALIRNAAPDETIVSLRTRLEDLLSGRLADPGLFFQPDTATGRYDDLVRVDGWSGPDTPYRKIEKLERDPVFLAWIRNTLFERIARRLMPGAVALYRSVVFAKAARTGSDTPWHQDGGRLWGLDRDPEVQLWTALDDAPVGSGCLEVLPGSHHAGLASPLGGVVPEAQVRAANADTGSVAIPARAGDVILLHNLLWHRSGPNATEHPRRAFTVCLMPAETRCIRTRRPPRTFLRVFAGG
jgi:hypothetical protein